MAGPAVPNATRYTGQASQAAGQDVACVYDKVHGEYVSGLTNKAKAPPKYSVRPQGPPFTLGGK